MNTVDQRVRENDGRDKRMFGSENKAKDQIAKKENMSLYSVFSLSDCKTKDSNPTAVSLSSPTIEGSQPNKIKVKLLPRSHNNGERTDLAGDQTPAYGCL